MLRPSCARQEPCKKSAPLPRAIRTSPGFYAGSWSQGQWTDLCPEQPSRPTSTTTCQGREMFSNSASLIFSALFATTRPSLPRSLYMQVNTGPICAPTSSSRPTEPTFSGTSITTSTGASTSTSNSASRSTLTICWRPWHGIGAWPRQTYARSGDLVQLGRVSSHLSFS